MNIVKKVIFRFLTTLGLILGCLSLQAQPGPGPSTQYCETTVTNLNIPGDVISAIKLSISNLSTNSMYVEIESANSDPVDSLFVTIMMPGVQISDQIIPVSGKIRRTLTFTGQAPPTVTLTVSWSKISYADRWMTTQITVPFTASCAEIIGDTIPPTAFSVELGTVQSNSIELLMNATDNTEKIVYGITCGASNFTVNGKSGEESFFNMGMLIASTAYTFTVTCKDAAGNPASNSPLVIIASTKPAYPVPPIIDFETIGYHWPWEIDQNGDNSPFLYSVVVNPSVSGLNMTDSCAKFVVNASATAWANLTTLGIDPFVVSNDNCMVKILVNKDVMSPFKLKFEDFPVLASFERSDSNTVINQWQWLYFDFSDEIGKSVAKMTLTPDVSFARALGSTNYFDQITFGSVLDGLEFTHPTVLYFLQIL